MVSDVSLSEAHVAAADAVREFYDGEEGALFSLVFGEQIHLGGFHASMALADLAGIQGGSGVDLCCCYGAGMRFLVRYRGVESMIGIDLSDTVQRIGGQRCSEEGITNVEFRREDACATSILPASVDFVWSEDAWCYVPDKDLLIAEAARIVRPGGIIAFTDWVEGVDLSDDERAFITAGMRIPSLETREGYVRLLEQAGCVVQNAEDTGTFAQHLQLAADMLDVQYRWDALRQAEFDQGVVDLLHEGIRLLAELGRAGKLYQVRIVACKQ